MKKVFGKKSLLLLALIVLMVLLIIYPVRNGITRPAIILTALAIYFLTLLSTWRKRLLRWTFIVAAIFQIMLLIAPGHSYERQQLQSDYIASLRSYSGTRYVWGGENHLGVDCSGLVRAAMVDALLRDGIQTINPQLIRKGLWLWWNDIAARDMPNGYSGNMETIERSTSLLTPSVLAIHPGDAAVTGDGSHVIAFLGNDRWIEADPISLRVVEWGANDRPQLLDRPMIVVRWRYLE